MNNEDLAGLVFECEDDGMKYIRFADIPEQYRPQFVQFTYGGQRPIVAGEGPCFYLQDWINFTRTMAL